MDLLHKNEQNPSFIINSLVFEQDNKFDENPIKTLVLIIKTMVLIIRTTVLKFKP